jgi:hypothetical protein
MILSSSLAAVAAVQGAGSICTSFGSAPVAKALGESIKKKDATRIFKRTRIDFDFAGTKATGTDPSNRSAVRPAADLSRLSKVILVIDCRE